MAQNLESFRELLLALRDAVHGESVLLSALGIMLTRHEPAFQPQSYGVDRLSDLLRLLPDVGAIVKDAKGADAFAFHDANSRSESPRSSSTLSSTGTDGKSGQPPSHADAQDSPLQRIFRRRFRRDLWSSVTSFHDSGWKFDLETFQLRNDENDPERLISDFPERFIDLPNAGAEFQKELARTFVKEHCPDLQAQIDTALDAPRWLTMVSTVLQPRGLAQGWFIYRTDALARCIMSWADAHGIPIENISEKVASPAKKSFLPAGFPPRHSSHMNTAEEARAVYHDAIDMMSLQELTSLPIPPIYLIMAAMQRSRDR